MDQKTADLLAQISLLLAQVSQLAPKAQAPVQAVAVDPTVGNTPGGLPMGTYSGPTVAVTATGARATGETRYWPVPLTGENWFGYLMRMCSVKRADGLPYVPAQYRAQISNVLLGGGPTRQADFPLQADAFAYPEQWRTQAQWDQAAKDEAGWADTHRRMQQEPVDAPYGGITL